MARVVPPLHLRMHLTWNINTLAQRIALIMHQISLNALILRLNPFLFQIRIVHITTTRVLNYHSLSKMNSNTHPINFPRRLSRHLHLFFIRRTRWVLYVFYWHCKLILHLNVFQLSRLIVLPNNNFTLCKTDSILSSSWFIWFKSQSNDCL